MREIYYFIIWCTGMLLITGIACYVIFAWYNQARFRLFTEYIQHIEDFERHAEKVKCEYFLALKIQSQKEFDHLTEALKKKREEG